MIILGLDTGSHTGWAVHNGGRILSGTHDIHKEPGYDNGSQFVFFRAWLSAMMTVYRPDVVVYEMPHLRGAGTQILVGFVAIVQELSTEYGSVWIEVHSATLKKHATGFGRSEKQKMMDCAVEKGWKFNSDDECDALWMIDWYLKESDAV